LDIVGELILSQQQHLAFFVSMLIAILCVAGYGWMFAIMLGHIKEAM